MGVDGDIVGLLFIKLQLEISLGKVQFHEGFATSEGGKIFRLVQGVLVNCLIDGGLVVSADFETPIFLWYCHKGSCQVTVVHMLYSVLWVHSVKLSSNASFMAKGTGCGL